MTDELKATQAEVRLRVVERDAALKLVRELEAELAKVNGLASGWNAAMRQEKARAEKAEKELAELQKDDAIIALMAARKRAEKAEAHAAKLRKAILDHMHFNLSFDPQLVEEMREEVHK